MRTPLSRSVLLAMLLMLGGALVPSSTTYAAKPLLLKPTGSCPTVTTQKDMEPMKVPLLGTKDGKVAVPTATTCGPDGLCIGTNIPCNYSLDDIKATAVGIGNWIFGIIGMIVLVMFMYGGAVWLMSAGNSTAVEHGRAIMTGSLIGLLLIFSAGAIVKFFLKSVGARPDIAASLPIDGNNAAGDDKTASLGQEQKHTVCNCKVTGVTGAQVEAHNFMGKPGSAVVNTANCKSFYVNMLKSRRDEIDPSPGTNATIQGEYAVYINKATCGVVTK